jgi:GTPase
MIRNKAELIKNIQGSIEKENDDGNHEYKLTLIDANEERIERIASQMRYRIEEGKGEAFYTLGVTDDGGIIGLDQKEYEKSYKVLQKAAKMNQYSMKLISSKLINNEKSLYEFLIRETNDNKYIDLRVACAGNVDSGKCLAKNTLVRMINGELIKVQDIKIGDYLMGDDSKSRKVLNTTKGLGMLYKINNNMIVNKNHILCLKATNRNFIFFGSKKYLVSIFLKKNNIPKIFILNPPSIEIEDYDLGLNEAKELLRNLEKDPECIHENDIIEISVEDYINLDKYTQSALKLYRVPVDYEYKITDFDPYIFGIWLGNGRNDNNNKELICNSKKLTKHLRYFLSLKLISMDETTPGRFILKSSQNLDFLVKDFIANCYKYNNKITRLEVLAGIIDSYYLFDNNSSSYTLLIPKLYNRLIDDIIEISNSVGIKTTVKNVTQYDENKSYNCTKIILYGKEISNIIPLVTESKIENKSDNSDYAIKNIESIGIDEYYGFELDGNQRYLHDDFTVSHNSSLLGVLLTNNNDDGRGSARLNVFNYQHEIKSGRTSSISQHILGFDSKGDTINYGDSFGRKKSWGDIVRDSTKIVTFYDLCGHEKYLKTTILGLTSQFPDLVFILVGANMGLSKMTREHIFLCLSLHIPFVIIITKIDICKDRGNVLKDTIRDIKGLLKAPGINKIPFDIKNTDDNLSAVKNINSNTIIPFFYISNVTGEGLVFLKSFLNLYKKKAPSSINENKVELHIDQTFQVTGVGLVVGGQLVNGKIKIGDKLMIGPNNNSYNTITVKSIHVKRVNVDEADSGCYVCLAIKRPEELVIRRGQVILSIHDKPIQTHEFWADITVLKSHSTTIKIGYQPVIHALSIRQSARITEIKNKQCAVKGKTESNNILRTGDKAAVKFSFSYKPEFLKKDTRIILAEGRIKIIGKITEFTEEILPIK